MDAGLLDGHTSLPAFLLGTLRDDPDRAEVPALLLGTLRDDPGRAEVLGQLRTDRTHQVSVILAWPGCGKDLTSGCVDPCPVVAVDLRPNNNTTDTISYESDGLDDTDTQRQKT